MRLIGLEPTRRETLDPKSSASTNFATGAILRCKGNDFLGAGQIFRRLFTLFSRARVLYMVWDARQKHFPPRFHCYWPALFTTIRGAPFRALLLRQQLSGVFNKRVLSSCLVRRLHAYLMCWGDAELGIFPITVVHRTGRETHYPAVGQLTRKR